MIFDRTKLELKPLKERIHDLDIETIRPLGKSVFLHESLKIIASRVVEAKRKNAKTILIMGGHVVRSGVQNFLIDLMRRGYISCLAMNGSGIIHDFEFAMIGKTTESVARYIKNGQFGLWTETGLLNDIINSSYKIDETKGIGEAVGKYIYESEFPYKNISLLAAAYEFGVPATVHVGIGYDIIHCHPNCNGAATGSLSYNDFLKFTEVVHGLENGVIMSFGSSVMAPEVFLKALSMARNVARQQGVEIKKFFVLVCDILDLPENISEEPLNKEPFYYFRPWKTLLVRTVADGGKSFYVKGSHANTIPSLWNYVNKEEKNG